PIRGPDPAGRSDLLPVRGDDHRRRGRLRLLPQHHLFGLEPALRLPRRGRALCLPRRGLSRRGAGADLRGRRAGADPLRHHAHQADRRGPEADQRAPRPARRSSIGAATIGTLTYMAVMAPWKITETPSWEPVSAALGYAFLTEYLLPFEVASVVLLAALVGA